MMHSFSHAVRSQAPGEPINGLACVRGSGQVTLRKWHWPWVLRHKPGVSWGQGRAEDDLQGGAMTVEPALREEDVGSEESGVRTCWEDWASSPKAAGNCPWVSNRPVTWSEGILRDHSGYEKNVLVLGKTRVCTGRSVRHKPGDRGWGGREVDRFEDSLKVESEGGHLMTVTPF